MFFDITNTKLTHCNTKMSASTIDPTENQHHKQFFYVFIKLLLLLIWKKMSIVLSLSYVLYLSHNNEK